MKPILKIALITIGTLFLALLIIVINYNTKAEVSTINFVRSKQSYLLVPLNIGDSTFYFIWDSGAERSIIYSKYGNYFDNYEVSETFNQKFEAFYDTLNIKSKVLKDVKFNIGNISIVKDMILTPFPNNHESKIIGVIGQDIIADYHWLFDVKHNKLTISNRKIKIQHRNSMDMFLNLEISQETSNIPSITIKNKNGSALRFKFDTGHSPIVVFDYATKYVEKPLFTINTVSYKDVVMDESFVYDVQGKNLTDKIIFLDSLDFNQKIIKHFSVKVAKTFNKENMISVHFVDLFDSLYYNPDDKYIDLKQSKSSFNSLDDSKIFLKYLKNLPVKP